MMITSGIYNGRIFNVNPSMSYVCDKPENKMVIYAYSGIYADINTDTSLYIGSAWNHLKRNRKHLWELRNNKHGNDHFSRAVKKYGINNFQKFVLEECENITRVDLLKREQEWTDFYNFNYSNHKVLFNIYEMVSICNDEKAIQKRTESFVKEYIITFPDGHEEIHKNLVKFCKEHNLHRASLAKTVTGMQNKHRGFQARYIGDDKQRYIDNTWKLKENYKAIEASKKFTTKEYEVIYPDGNRKIIRNLREFCRTNDIYYGGALDVIRGKQKHYKKYKFIKLTKNNNFKKRTSTGKPGKYLITTPENVSFEIENLSQYCRDNNLNYHNMQCACLEQRTTHGGYTIKKLNA